MSAQTSAKTLEEGIAAFRMRLLHLAERYLHPLLQQRLSAEDILQDTLRVAAQSPHFLTHSPEVPLYFKLRKLLFQTLIEAERHHLKTQKRDLYREIPITLEDNSDATSSTPQLHQDALIANISSPFTKTARQDRHALLKQVLNTLPTSDRQILTMRHFDDCTNSECAAILNIPEKTASQRYIRALTRLQERLRKFTEFHA